MVLPRLLAELKHRKVYRAAVVYAAVGWALLEAADVVLPRLGLPDWTVNVVLAVVLLGFPLAIVFAWIFDLSPQGIVRTQPLSAARHHHTVNVAAIVEFVLIVALVVLVGGLYVDRLSLQQRLTEAESAVQGSSSLDQQVIPNPEQYRAIAVLPFADMSEAGDQAWFAEGIAEELLIALSQVDELRVIARTSSFAFKDADKTIAEIASNLGVQAVLEGSVRRSGERVRISAQLIDARTDYHIWSGSYERQLTDIFALQDELARDIVEALRIELGVDSVERLVAEQTRSLEAYNWYMRGRASLDWARPDIVYQSISYFERAVAADPDYALAWGALAAARALLVLWRPFDEVQPGIGRAYQNALALDSQQSEALAAKALMTQIKEYDWEKAGKLYQRAISARENTTAITMYAIYYLPMIDRLPEAIHLYAEAEKRDPLRAGYKAALALLLVWSGDLEAAIKKAQEALELSPRHEFALMALVDAYIEAGNCAGALDVVEDLSVALRREPRINARAARCYALQGDYVKASKIYEDVVENTLPSRGTLIYAQLALSLGQVEDAIDMMEREVENSAWTQFLIRRYFAHNDALKTHPRFLALLKSIGLDDESVAKLD